MTSDTRPGCEPLQWLSPLGMCLGVAWYLYVGGWPSLDPSNFDWVVGDHAQHLLGWLFFRNETWSLPLGTITSLMHPVGTTLGFTDSNPWVSLLLKPLAPWLPVDFQFIGLWLLLCFVLQGHFGARISATLTRDPWQAAAGTALFVCAPVLVSRIGHDTLSAHWLLLALIWLHRREGASIRSTLLWVFALNVLAAGVHPYLAVMVLALTLALLLQLVREGAMPVARTVTVAAGLLVQAGSVSWLLGYLGGLAELSGGGFGNFSADTLTFFNSMHDSRWLPGFRVGEWQYEGFAYLGVGVLGLIGVLGGAAIGQRRCPTIEPRFAPLVVVAVLMAVFALSSHVTVAGHLVLTMRGAYDQVAPVVDPLRASGRFIWPLYYVLITGVLSLAVRRHLVKSPVATTLLLAAVVAQVVEVRPDIHFTTRAWPRVQSPVWQDLTSTYRHMVIYPSYYTIAPSGCDPSPLDYTDVTRLSDLAYRKALTINSAYVARLPASEVGDYCRQLKADVEGGSLLHDGIYVVTPRTAAALSRSGATCGTLDGFNVCVADVVRTRFQESLAATPGRLP